MVKRIYLPISILFILFFFINNCSKSSEQSIWINPIIIDGINIYPMNTLADEMRFKGAWTAPKVGKNKKVYRKINMPGGELFFNAVKKERYVVRILLLRDMNISVTINNKTFEKKGKKMLFSLYPKDIIIGKNILKFNIEKDQALYIRRIEIYPKRTGKSKKKNLFFTPSEIIYYLNPDANTKISFGLDWEGRDEIKALINIESEKKKKHTI